MDGFSYCGVHCSELGLQYIPSPENRMLKVPEYE